MKPLEWVTPKQKKNLQIINAMRLYNFDCILVSFPDQSENATVSVHGDYIHGCQPGNNTHKLAGSVASWMRLFTCPLTLRGTPSSIPSSFSCSLRSTLSAILLVELLPLPAPEVVWSPSNISPPPAVEAFVSSASALRWRFRAFKGLMVQRYRGSYSRT